MLNNQATDRRDKQLLSYALVAGAGLIASSQPAEAGVLYSGPIDLIFTGGTMAVDFIGSDVGTDFEFTISTTSSTGPSSTVFYKGKLSAKAFGNNRIAGFSQGIPAFSQSSSLYSQNNFVTMGTMAFGSSTSGGARNTGGSFANAGPKFLGFRIDFSGNPHLGWFRFDIRVGGPQISAKLMDFAYEDTSGEPIHFDAPAAVPEPGSLSLLALGTAGLAAWRRRTKRNPAA